MCGSSHYVESVVKRMFHRLAGDESRDMRDIHYRDGADLVRDRDELCIIQFARIRREAGENNLRLCFLRDATHLVIINLARLHVLHLVPYEIENLGEIRDRVPVREVPAMREVHPEDSVAG